VSKYKEIDLKKIKTYPIDQRYSKVNINAFAKKGKVKVNDFFNCLPDILAAKDLKELILTCKKARENHKPIIIGLGAHIIKCGLAPLLIEMMEEDFVSAFVCNGAVAIHDYEIASFGKTSEDVSSALSDGSFGMAEETVKGINEAINKGFKESLGLGEAIGKELYTKAKYKDLSLLASAYKWEIPVCVQVAIGTDIIHQSPYADGKAIGDCSMRDFRIFAEKVSELNRGGVFLNLGSAVIVPEVFLKALTVARNIYGEVQNFTTAVFDFNVHYRPKVNVAERPVENGGKGYYFIGQNEIMVPLLLKAIME